VRAGAGNPNRPGGAGTVYVKDKLARTGTLTVDSAGVGRFAITPLALEPTDTVGVLTSVILKGSGLTATLLFIS
jgi:hypothetical protein